MARSLFAHRFDRPQAVAAQAESLSVCLSRGFANQSAKVMNALKVAEARGQAIAAYQQP
ncbi:MAG TPA: hypothetical protein VEY11_17545 [Pyrinomonadaceae bacterium]|nr:hypothetical protein [Pyrinomonadaceae bacterium]